MSRTKTTLFAAVVGVAACSVINAPEDLKPVDDGGGAQPGAGTDSGASGGSANKAGSKNGGSANQSGRTSTQAGEPAMPDAGAGGCTDCGEGGTPPIGRDCTVSSTDCASTAPICDSADGVCRACKTDMECSKEVGKALCVTDGVGAGRCGACKTNTDCTGRTPTCNTLSVCRACTADTDCDSNVCETNGGCAATGEAVYASADKGDMSANCGTIDLPCVSLAMAASKLTPARHNLVLVKGAKKFTEATTLPQITLRVIGNGSTINAAGNSAFTVPANASVSFDNVVIEGTTTMAKGGIQCSQASISVTNSTIQNNLNGILASDCDVQVGSSIFKNNTGNNGNGTGLYSTCTAESCDRITTVLRSKFIDNEFALQFDKQKKTTIENNLFLRNGYNYYTRVLSLYSEDNRVAYNTFVQNFNNGTYVGIVACVGKCTVVGNVSFNNFPNHPEYQNQVFYGNNSVKTYNVTEYMYGGDTNQVGDPKFVDPANGDFTPGPGSPAIDKGDPKDVPPFDIDGNKRPVGKGPDIGAFEAQ